MKKLLLLALLTLHVLTASSQITYVNLTTLATNVTTSSAVITIPGLCTNYAYTVVNSNNIVIGDPLPSAFAAVNSSFTYVSNELAVLGQLPYQYNTNLAALINAQSNRLNALVSSNSLLASGAAANAAANLAVSNDWVTFLATNVFISAGGQMKFDGGLIVSDGAGNLSLNGGCLYTANNAAARYYFGPDPANPGISGTAYSLAYNLSAHMDIVATSSGYAQLCCRTGNNGSGTAMIYCDIFGNAQLWDELDGSHFFLNAGGTVDVVDGSGLGQHLDGSGNVAFDGASSFAGGGAALVSDSAGNGGVTLMLQASDTGLPMYLHVSSAGAVSVTTTR